MVYGHLLKPPSARFKLPLNSADRVSWLFTARINSRLALLKEMDDEPSARSGREWLCRIRDLNPKLTDVGSLKPLGRETRKHPAAQIRKLQSSLEQFGIVLPVIVDAERRVIAGWGLVLAARKMGLLQVPAVTIDDLDEAKLRLLRLALNRLGEEFELGLRRASARVR